MEEEEEQLARRAALFITVNLSDLYAMRHQGENHQYTISNSPPKGKYIFKNPRVLACFVRDFVFSRVENEFLLGACRVKG